MVGKLLSILLAVLFLFYISGMRAEEVVKAEPQGTQEARIPEPAPVLSPSVAGSFYSGDAGRLKDDVTRYLESAEAPDIQGEIVAVVVPHAGYVYSAPVAAYAYRAIAGQFEKPDAVVVLAFDHRGRHPGVSVYYKGAVETPLGRKIVNEKVAREFMGSDPRLSFSEAVFAGEHSGEVQIPFLQMVLPDVPVVPVIFGRQTMENIEAVSKGLEKIARKYRIIVVASTDLSHYHPYDRANLMDSQTVKLMLECNPKKMAQYIGEYPDRMCGPGPVLAAISFAKSQEATPVLLKYANSGDTAGDKGAVVGYAALAFTKKDLRHPAGDFSREAEASGEEESYVLTEDDKKLLLRLARRSLESFVRDGKTLTVESPASPILVKDGAAFVTLKKDGRLRGCIGNMQATAPLYMTVIEMAVTAASRDPRFPPVRPNELEDIHIEISVNTPLRPVSGPDEIVLGKHGVVVTKGLRQGVFLPQVATETGWTKEEFLRNLCAHKTGLAPDAYKKDAKLSVFTSIVFEEQD